MKTTSTSSGFQHLTAMNIGDFRQEVMTVGWSNWWPYDTHNHYHYGTIVTTPNATEQAFKVVSKLIEEGVIKEMSVTEFVKTVSMISKEL